ncbi:MAG: hypothetical protein Q9170_003632 [Blastenia crenularia]
MESHESSDWALMCRTWDKAVMDRISAKLWEKEQRRQTKAAQAAGFDCYEDYCRHLDEASERRFQEYVDEQCAETGKSEQQVRDDHYNELYAEQDKPLIPWDHPFDPFCPQNLVDFRSQDDPDTLDYLNSRSRFKPSELSVREGDSSNRLKEEDLKQYWARMGSQGPQMPTPFWARADKVVQQIRQQEGSRKSPISPPSPVPHNRDEHSDDTMSDTPALDDSMTSISAASEPRNPPTAPQYRIPRGGRTGSHKDGRVAKRPPAQHPVNGPKNRPTVTNRRSRVTKAYGGPATRLRSRQFIKFVQLASNGRAIPWSSRAAG